MSSNQTLDEEMRESMRRYLELELALQFGEALLERVQAEAMPEYPPLNNTFLDERVRL